MTGRSGDPETDVPEIMTDNLDSPVALVTGGAARAGELIVRTLSAGG
jgi:hypothetical protein